MDRSNSVPTGEFQRAHISLKNQGFTIIELMIVVAVISVLLVISIPIYQSYTARAQLAEGMNLSAFVKQKISEIKTFQGTLPNVDPANLAMGLPAPSDIKGEYVSAVTVRSNPACTPTSEPVLCYPADGTIEIEYKTASAFGGNNIHGVQPFFLTGAIKWDCASDATQPNHVPVQFRPPICRP